MKAKKNKKSVDSEKKHLEIYEGKKYIVCGAMKNMNNVMVMCTPKNTAEFFNLPEEECIFDSITALESKGVDPSKYKCMRPTDDIFEWLYQNKLAKEQGERQHV